MKPYITKRNFTYIVIGEEANENIPPIMKALQGILNANFIGNIKLTTILSYDTSLAIKDDPPSNGAFHSSATNTLRGIINFLVEQGSPLLVAVYPYQKFINDNRDKRISIMYATFEATKPVQDGALSYYNLFDAMVDTFHAAMEKLGGGEVTLVVGETGWPTSGHGNEATVALAAKYNQKLKTHVRLGKETPRRPNVDIQCFIRTLFNEDRGAGGDSNYYRVFKSDLSPVYDLF